MKERRVLLVFIIFFIVIRHSVPDVERMCLTSGKENGIMQQHGQGSSSTSSSSSQNYSGASGGGSHYSGSGSSSYSAKLEDMEFPYCPDANKYEKLAKIGQGTFG